MVRVTNTPAQSAQPTLDARGYRRMMTALLAAGVATFAGLYAVQGVLPEMASALQVTSADAALSVSAATTGLALAVLPWAWLADRLGRLRAMQVSVAAAVLLGTAAALAPTFEIMLATRFLTGAALAGVPVLAVAYVHEHLRGGQAAAAAAAYISGTTVGGAAGRLIAGPLAPLLGWRGALVVVSVIGVVCALLFIALAPRSPRSTAQAQARRQPQLPRLRAALGVPALVRVYLAIPLITGSFVAVYNFLGFRLGAAPFGLPAALVSLIFLTYAAGTLSSRSASALLPRLGLRGVVAIGLGAMVLGLLAMVPDTLPLLIAGLIAFTGGFFVVHAAAVASTGALAPAHARSQASALYTIGYYVGSGVLGWALGLFYEHGGWSLMTAAIVATLALAGGTILTTRTQSRTQPATPATARHGLLAGAR